METVVAQVFTGLSSASVLLLVAIGLTLTFGQMGVINMAHGEFLMAGSYTAFVTASILRGSALSLPVALVVGFLIGGLLGIALEATILRWMYDRPLDTLLVTFGVGLILQQLARDIFGAPAKEVSTPTWLSGTVPILGYGFPVTRLFIIALSALCVAGLFAMLRLTDLGRRIRATVANRDLAESLGISTRRTDRTTFFIGSGLAGVAGVALTLLGSTGPTVGTSYIVEAFLVVVVGGIGQLKGTILAALGIGIGRSFLESWTSGSMAQVLMLLAIVAFLQIRPQGIFTTTTRSLA
ncbi:MAG: urea ABC transporter permease subunit UrtB [Actinobacteria bacterium]|jgi:urea transport system permease protein|uniref:Putative branched-chain amino acid transporter n=1 Tax=Nostocoides jenkinsii Ben 74 TaxID=1193518 RepID=A0A077MFJ4_9MICO|nr:urea ABC transporter permease subunit UrtB [Tetrasphaera jenkinsii]MCA0181255.1 urea ABC transporter permease subunit UrtB [Actinomycetota bacterium]MCI1261237.1 urea ABC transporter permease subunit UrtB [Tetrasphaera jenkinsii]CCI53918.1 putative branched-chain amino acid transporter [Tetrasphaera jenkinsii Ben 74]